MYKGLIIKVAGYKAVWVNYVTRNSRCYLDKIGLRVLRTDFGYTQVL